MITETLTWHRDPADLPDADTTVLIELDPAGDYSEPVWLGYHDGSGWLDAQGDAVEVIAWAQPPLGSRAAVIRALNEAAGMDLPADPCPQCRPGGTCNTAGCGRMRSSELMELYGTSGAKTPDGGQQ